MEMIADDQCFFAFSLGTPGIHGFPVMGTKMLRQ